MKTIIPLSLMIAVNCLMAPRFVAASERKGLPESPKQTMSTEQSRRVEEAQEEAEEERDDESDDSSEVPTEIDSMHDDEEKIYQGESSSAALSQPKRDETAPGDDQSLLDLAELTSCLEKLKATQESHAATIKERAVSKREMEAVARGVGYFKNVCDLRTADERLLFYQRCAGRVCLKWQQVTETSNEKENTVLKCYQKAFDYLEQAITSRQEQIRCGSHDLPDDLRTESLYSLAETYHEEARVRRDQEKLGWRKTIEIVKACAEARKAFEGSCYEVDEGRRHREVVNTRLSNLSGQLKILSTLRELSTASALKHQRLGNEILAKIPNKEPL